MSETERESFIEGIGISICSFAIVELIVEGFYGKTRKLLEFFRMNPDSPNLLQLYVEAQMNKGVFALIVFVILLVLLKKLDVEINRWHIIAIVPSLIGYGFYIFLKYSYLFPVT